MARQLFEAFGWIQEDGRLPKWESGESIFLHHPDGGVYLQLTVEDAGFPGESTNAFHVAFVCEDVAEVHAIIWKWCKAWGAPIFEEELGDGKIIIRIPDLMFGAIELIPEKKEEEKKRGPIRRDFRVLQLPESARSIPAMCALLKPGQELRIVVDGGLATAELIVKIVNDRMIEEGKALMAYQDINPAIHEIGFKCTAI